MTWVTARAGPDLVRGQCLLVLMFTVPVMVFVWFRGPLARE